MNKNKFLSLLAVFSILLGGCSNKENVVTAEDQSSILSNDASIEANLDTGIIDNFVTNATRKVFDEYDKNKNGFIEASELPYAPNSFKKLDRNKDNKLSFDEAKYSLEDTKKISLNIYNFYNLLFNAADTNDDGYLSIDEMTKNTELSNIQDLNAFSQLKNSMSKNGVSQKININQFSNFMNSSFLELQRTNLLAKFPKSATVSTTDSNKLPIILVQGYSEPSWYFMYGIYRNLKKNGWANIYPVNLFPNIADITEQAKIVSAKIEQAKKENNVSKVDYIAHSMGGLIGRYYIQNMNGVSSINHYISISTPHYGTYVAWAGPGEAGKQMRPGSDFLTKLNTGNPIQGNISYTSIWTKTDEIVIPAENALLRGSKIMPEIKNVGHFLIMWSNDTYKQIRDALTDKNLDANQ